MSRIRRISNSEITTYRRCKRKWWLAWHRGLAPRHEPMTGPLAVGARVHEALADVYQPGNGVDWSELRQVLDNLLEDDRRRLVNGSVFESESLKLFDSEAELQRIMLEGYVQWLEKEGVDDGYEVIAAEDYVEAPFMNARGVEAYIIGRLDLRVRRLRDGKILFWDHKTTASTIAALMRDLRRSTQMRMYRMIALLTATPEERPGGAVFSIMRKVKRTAKATPPFYHREVVDFNPHELETFVQQLRGVIMDILDTEDVLDQVAYVHHQEYVYPNPTKDCSWDCIFYKECQMLDDGSRAEDALEANFVQKNPLHYYGREDIARHDDAPVA
jgi:RecB family exonuclease